MMAKTIAAMAMMRIVLSEPLSAMTIAEKCDLVFNSV